MSIMQEIKFQIYKFYATWDQDNFENNGTGYSIMYKENPTVEQLENELQEFKLGILSRHNGVIFKNAEYEFVEDESWCCNWFNHYTYNQFETDSEVRNSFREFVRRKELIKDYCLMGADESYRWKICRCENCKRLGKITIDH